MGGAPGPLHAAGPGGLGVIAALLRRLGLRPALPAPRPTLLLEYRPDPSGTAEASAPFTWRDLEALERWFDDQADAYIERLQHPEPLGNGWGALWPGVAPITPGTVAAFRAILAERSEERRA